MTGQFGTLVLTFLAAVGFDRRLEWGVNWPPDTPASDLVILCYPYAVAKNHSLGPTAPTELIELDQCYQWKCMRFVVDWVNFDGLPRPTICDDAQQTAVAGTWLVVRDRQGQCYTFDTTNRASSSAMTDLDGVNQHLAKAGVPPVTDADFRTFEQLADERDRRKLTLSLSGLAAVAVGWLVVVGATFWFKRRAG